MAADQWEIVVVRHGTRHARRSDVYMNYGFYGEADDDFTVDYYLWVLRNGEQIIHVDTGYSQAGAAKRGRTVLIDPLEALRRLGASAESGNPLVVTHAHYDHIGNVAAFANSPIYMSGAELEFWTSDIATRPLFSHYGDQDEIADLLAAEHEGRLVAFSGRLELSPGVELIEIGGHTPGELVVSVQTRAGEIILAGDAAHFREELDRDMLFQSMADVPQSYRALDWLRSQTDACIITGHDAGELDRFTPLDGALAGHAAVAGRAP
ncbi:N-acyl homoserine lactonase family protein [Leucobacter tardus]|uniref:N-acyl homoserine lactonase family protein n=1 Tax=Leucobacter tardus TaxID=501483 RepID=A0A939TJE7_9MICO|nr:N-acyl homoserine lactonase family protein [Leucobacter tardus]MBO2989156.1 N-acyl homoserine lactonase family protein [Leucobacter tardus]